MIPALDEYIHLTGEIRRHTYIFTDDPSYDRAKVQLRAEILQPTIEYYADFVEPELKHSLAIGYMNTPNSREIAVHIRGLVESYINKSMIYSSVLSGSHLHEAVWTQKVRALWRDFHHLLAVEEAARSVERHLQAKLGTSDHGLDLFKGAFSPATKPGHPVLLLREFQSDSATEEDAHQGANGLGRACWQLTRNLTTHDKIKLPWHEALEHLAVLSTYARLVDQAEVIPSGPSGMNAPSG